MTSTIQTFDYSVDVQQALLWQFQQAARLQELLLEKQAWYDAYQKGFWTSFHDDIFNLATANYFGLSVWAIILGQPIVFNNSPNPGQVPWGFGVDNADFTQGNFAQKDGFTYVLPAASARILLQLRYFQLTSSGTVPETNRMLKYVFGQGYGPAWLVDNHDMTQTYFFNFPLTPDLVYLFKYLDILPRPAGVASTYEVI